MAKPISLRNKLNKLNPDVMASSDVEEDVSPADMEEGDDSLTDQKNIVKGQKLGPAVNPPLDQALPAPMPISGPSTPSQDVNAQREGNLRKQLGLSAGTSELDGAARFYADMEKQSMPAKPNVDDLNKERSNLRDLIKQAEDKYSQGEERLGWAKVADQAAKALTQLAAGYHGLKTGVDMGGVKFDKADWSQEYQSLRDKLNRDLGQIGERSKMLDTEELRRAGAAEAEGKRKQEFLLSQYKSPEALAQQQLKQQGAEADIEKTKAETAKTKQEMQFLKAQQAQLQALGPKQSPAEQELSKQFAKDTADFINQGGSSSAQRDIDQLKEAKKILDSGTDTISGPVVGFLTKKFPDAARSLNPTGTKVQDYIQGVVQKTAKTILGAQYTEKEGERLMAKAYDPQASEQENAKRVSALIDQLESAKKIREEAIKYSNDHRGSLAGFDAINKLPKSIDEINLGDENEPAAKAKSEPSANAVVRRRTKDGKVAEFNPETKQFIRFVD